MIMRNIYPFSPPSENESLTTADLNADVKERPLTPTHAPIVSASASPVMASSPSLDVGRRQRPSPPRTATGQMYCDHVGCGETGPVFSRLCEWNKHMDRHERPFKCLESGCERNPGFTYSGGLLRHQREVHKMHLSTKEPIFCPVPTCNRSRAAGHGFTRKENLEEHKRRRHVNHDWAQTCDAERTTQHIGGVETTVCRSTLPMAKRRRLSSTDGRGQDLVHEQASTAVAPALVDAPRPFAAPDVHVVVQQLHLEIQQKNDRIRRQALEIQRLQKLLHELTPASYYKILPPQLPGNGVG